MQVWFGYGPVKRMGGDACQLVCGDTVTQSLVQPCAQPCNLVAPTSGVTLKEKRMPFGTPGHPGTSLKSSGMIR